MNDKFSLIKKPVENEQDKYLRTDDMETEQPENISLWVLLTSKVDSFSILPSILSTILVLVPSAIVLYCFINK